MSLHPHTALTGENNEAPTGVKVMETTVYIIVCLSTNMAINAM